MQSQQEQLRWLPLSRGAEHSVSTGDSRRSVAGKMQCQLHLSLVGQKLVLIVFLLINVKAVIRNCFLFEMW